MKNNTNQPGFTLVELIIAMAILAIIAAIGTTGLINYLPYMRLKSASRDIFSAMMQAKVEAIRRGENVTIRFNPPAAPYSPVDARIPVNSYVMFLDNGSGVGGVANDEKINGTEPIIQVATVLPDRVFFDGATTFGNDSLVFTSRGIPIDAALGGLGAGKVKLLAVDSHGNTVRQRAIAVSSAGRISMN